MSVVYIFVCGGSDVAMDFPSPRIARILKSNASEAFEAVFGMQSETRATSASSLSSVRAGVDTLLEVCRNKTTVKSESERSAWGFRTVYEGGVTEIDTGSTGLFQLEPEGNYFVLSARNGRSCRLEEFVEGTPDLNGNRFQKIGERKLPLGTVIRPCSYKTWYIVAGGRANLESFEHQLIRLHDVLSKGDGRDSVTVSVLV